MQWIKRPTFALIGFAAFAPVVIGGHSMARTHGGLMAILGGVFVIATSIACVTRPTHSSGSRWNRAGSILAATSIAMFLLAAFTPPAWLRSVVPRLDSLLPVAALIASGIAAASYFLGVRSTSASPTP